MTASLETAGDTASETGEQSALASRQSFCDYLVSARKQRNRTLDDIASVTRIPARSLEWLESGEFEKLPADVFVRGFLRSYARCVGLDVEETIRRYNRCGMTPAPVSSPMAEELAGSMATLEDRDYARTVRRLTTISGLAANEEQDTGVVQELTASVGQSGPTSSQTSQTSRISQAAGASSRLTTTLPAVRQPTVQPEQVRQVPAQAAGGVSEAREARAEQLAEPAQARDAAGPRRRKRRRKRKLSGDAPEVQVAEPAALQAVRSPHEPETAVSTVAPLPAQVPSQMASQAALGQAQSVLAPVQALAPEGSPASSPDAERAPQAAASLRLIASPAAAQDTAPQGSQVPGAMGRMRSRRARRSIMPQPVLVIDDACPEEAERLQEARAERGDPSWRTFLPPSLLDSDEGSHRGALTLAVIILVIVATLTMSYLLRRPSGSGDGITYNTVRPGAAELQSPV